MEVRVTGADTFAKGLETVLKETPQMKPREVGRIILQAARARTPVKTGALRASGLASGMNVTFRAPYAAPIHWGWRKRNIDPNPFVVRGTMSSADAWVSAFADALQERLDRTL